MDSAVERQQRRTTVAISATVADATAAAAATSMADAARCGGLGRDWKRGEDGESAGISGNEAERENGRKHEEIRQSDEKGTNRNFLLK